MSSKVQIGVVLALMLVTAPRAHAQDVDQGAVQDADQLEAPPEATHHTGEAENSESAQPAGAEENVSPIVAERLEQARQRFLRGIELADRGDCAGAVSEFQASLDIAVRPSTLYNIARCQERLHRYDAAIRAYELYLRDAPPDDRDRPRAEATIAGLRSFLGTLSIECNTAAEVWVDGRIVGEAPGQLSLPSGQHTLELRAEGYLSEQRDITVRAQSRTDIRIELGPAEVHEHINIQAPPIPRAVTLGVGGLAITALITGAGFGIRALRVASAEEARDPRLPRDADTVARAALLGDVFLIGGGVLAATTLALGFLTDWKPNVQVSASSAHVLATWNAQW